MIKPRTSGVARPRDWIRTGSGSVGRGASLREAAQRATAVWRRECRDAVNAEDASDLTSAIVAAIENHVTDGSVDARLRSDKGRRLLELIQSEAIQVWGEHAESLAAGDMLCTLKAIGSLRAILGSGQQIHLDNRLQAIAQNLRSPLTAILFLTEALQRGLSGDINELQRRQLGLIYGAALGLSEMASNVLELIEDRNRLAEDQPSPFSVTEILQSVVDITRPMFREKGLILRLSPPSQDHRLGHPLALRRVLLNLTSNAVNFVEEGVVEIVARDTSETRIEFAVWHSGPGIDPDAFEFSQARLGLALCRRLVEAMGSELQAGSQPGSGNRFYFEIEFPPVSAACSPEA